MSIRGHCQSGKWDVCLAGSVDGICCAEDECDIDDGIRKAPQCHAGRDGDCNWKHCPQERDGEPAKTGRHCPLDKCPDCGTPNCARDESCAGF